MRKAAILAVALACAVSQAQVRIWRCGNTYTNNGAEAVARGCLAMQGGNITIVDGERESPVDIKPGRLTIKRAPDTHFYVTGSVNGVPVRFMVDTGATSVSVSDRVASAADLAVSRVARLNTAGGQRVAVAGKGLVRVGDLVAPGIDVVAGLPANSVALLGQSFLREFDFQVTGDTMVIKRRVP